MTDQSHEDDETLTGEAESASSASLPPSAADDSRFPPGTVLAGRYRVVNPLGKGGMGEVYRADDLKLGVPVALKLLPAAVEGDPHRLSLLFDELKVARQITHANVCRVYDLAEADGVHLLSMEYIDGEDLNSLLRRIGRLPGDKAVEIGLQICSGLAAVHEAGMLHRDLKPANLMLDGEGRARITDFGLATLSDSVHGVAIRSGTPAYMAPEQHAGREVSRRSDIFALGLVLYEIFTGRRPFERVATEEAAVTAPSSLVLGFDPGIEKAILDCLAFDPADRPSSVEQVGEALAAGGGAAEGARVATLLLSDLVGSSGLVQRRGDGPAAELFARHDRIVRDLLKEHGGREIDKSDGFLLLFDRPWQALQYALAYHRALADLSRAEEVELESCVGIHLGEIVLRRNSSQDVARGAKPLELEGLARPNVARLVSLAGGRQTLMTRAAFELARRSAIGSAEEAERLRWLAHGSYLFKDDDEPVEIFEVGVGETAPLIAPQGSENAAPVEDDKTLLGWRPAPGLPIPNRPNWIVVEKLGEGGFGEVWLGEQCKTGDRRVYKFCFEAERLRSLQREITVFRLLKEELGLRDDIARILDWNLDESPYFIEFTHIDGGDLVDWAATLGGIAELRLTDRLDIVAQVATALAAAHSVGVLHKDVKPANVLMARDAEGKPRAVLTDFGVGLVTDRERLAARGITAIGMTEVELASGGSSMGGTQLYMAPELLAGQPSTIQADIFALGVMLYQMVVGDLERPLAQGWERHVEDELLRDDIAALIDGSPARRPAGAAEVAERLRTLEQRRAAREAERQALRVAERAHRRRKLLVTVAAVSSVFLVVVSVLAIQAVRARADAERRRGQAEQLIDFMLNDLHEGLDKIGRLDLLEGVARTSRDYFDSLAARDRSPDHLYKRGLTALNVGDVLLEQGDAEAALATQRSAVALFEEALESDPVRSDWQQGLGLSRLNLGEVLANQGDYEAARVAYIAAIEAMQGPVAAEPENRDYRFVIAKARYELAGIEAETGAETVVPSLREAVKLAEQVTSYPGDFAWRHWVLLLDARTRLATMLRFRNELVAAVPEFDAARKLAERLAEEDAANVIWNRRLAWMHFQIGALYFEQRELASALDSFNRSRALYELLISVDPSRVTWYGWLAETLRAAGMVHAMQDQPEEALRLYREALPLLERLLVDDPTRLGWLEWLAPLHNSIGKAHLQLGDTAAALEAFEEVRSLRLRLFEDASTDPRAQHLLADVLVILGNVQAARGESDTARDNWLRALELSEPVTAQSRIPTYLDTHARALLQLDRIDEAKAIVEELAAQGWDEPLFLELIRDKGLEDLLH